MAHARVEGGTHRSSVKDTTVGKGHQLNDSDTLRSAHCHAKIDESSSFDEQEVDGDIPERFRPGKKFRSQHMARSQATSQNRQLDISLNKDIRKYIEEQEHLSSNSAKQNWVNATELPRSSEIHVANGTNIKLLPNKKDKPFKSVEKYLKTHYDLLREDAIGPLREVVDKFRQNPTIKDNTELSVYDKVHISGFTFTNMGIAARIKFSTQRAERKIKWSASRRLISGTLVALSPASDHFSTKCIVAIVAARPLDLLERTPPEVDIYFSCPEDIEIDPQKSFVMVEAKQGYYEAYRHTLRALQKLSKEQFPLSEHIIGTNTDIGPPNYLANNPYRSLAATLNLDSDWRPDLSSTNIVTSWPEVPPESTLDNSQWEALKQILTSKIAIIQGPPGTGKTHVSKVALEVLVQNRTENDPPIIVAAQTNHALDQLLRHVSVFDPNFVRLGGRSVSAEVKKRALYEVRKREVIPKIPGSSFGYSMKRLREAQARLHDILALLDNGSKAISAETLTELKIINPTQRQSLLKAADNWVTADEDDQSHIELWLDNALVPFEVTYNDDDFGFEDVEEDLELEQVKEMEAEHGVTDEEDIEMLKGPWESVSDHWTVAQPCNGDLQKATKLLSTKQDLWGISEYQRKHVYWVMKEKAKDVVLSRFREEAKAYENIVQELKIGKYEKDAVFLKRANIIGMTTTGLSKYRPLIASLRPKTILIEEAAEVIEGPVTAACLESVEHLILVGDHKQLKGHCALLDLEDAPYFLNVSMFERLVNLRMPFKSLSRQRRMNPEIRELVSWLYPQLEDHQSVLTREQPPQWGTGPVRSFFFNHDWSELKDQLMSTYNEQEARMVAKFYRHLLRHGVDAAAITVLTFYHGQRKQILKELKSDPETNAVYNKVKTVDSYQGEENDIVILSLVRSNTEGKVGFLDVDNRVCVALSRAKYGFYLFGNGQLMSEKSELWFHVWRIMFNAQPPRFGSKLPLTCVNHNRIIDVQWPEDFDKNDGGCDLGCEGKLECGHICPRKCHPTGHHDLQCDEKCVKKLLCGHSCVETCCTPCRCPCREFQSTADARIVPDTDGRYQSDHNGGDAVTYSKRSEHSGSSGMPEKATTNAGADFQPLRKKFDQRPHRTQVLAKLAGKDKKPHTWTSFANGGFRENDEDREKFKTPQRDAVVGDLLDFSPLDDLQDGVKDSHEENIGENRMKFTQTYRPVAHDPLGFSGRTNLQRTPSKNKPLISVINLMD